MIALYFKYWLIITTVTWISFFAGFWIENKYQGESNKLTRLLKKIFIYSLDIPCNIFLSIVPFFQLPEKWDETVTDRLTRYLTRNGRYWRWRIANMICQKFDIVDDGHCS